MFFWRTVIDSEAEEVLAEFDFLSNPPTSNSTVNNPTTQSSSNSTPSTVSNNSATAAIDSTFTKKCMDMEMMDIGELAAISINDDFESENSNKTENQAVNYRKTWNSRYLLKWVYFLLKC